MLTVMENATKVFLGKRFKQYYWDNSIPAPSEVHKREFGFGTLDDKIKFRHKSFESREELQAFLKRDAPYFISYSAAYYEFPANQPMEAKNWLGADLIFDLDVDMKYLSRGRMEEMMRQARAVVGFLENDFGLGRKDISVNFSGSKGYHIHVSNDDVKCLGGEERRRIVDYVTGSGLDLNAFMKSEDSAGGLTYVRGKPKFSEGVRVGPTARSRGWAKRVFEVTRDFLNSSPEDMKSVRGVGDKTVGRLLKDRERNLEMIEQGRWDGMVDLGESLRDKIISEKAVVIKDADKQVTLDTARLIRLPESLHGGSGLKASVAKNLESFNPLVDAVAFKDEDVKILFKNNVPKFDLMENRWGPYRENTVEKVPEYAGVYLMLHGDCEVSQ
ncbi:MAG TPA: DNA primase catalytic subunit PriS [Candidatus Altiarchaeales archaeon]|nr:DNA primase catalytic subunit PriS [Candidatus Altiarchaeales archaeon]